MRMHSPTNLLRSRVSAEDGRVTFLELFFDLVFVFAITQLSHKLLHDFSVTGGAETAFLLFAVWWVWLYTAWVTNWLDPQRTPVRLLLFALMLAGLVMTMSIPEAFASSGIWFALAYAGAQVGRSLFMLWALAGYSPRNFENFRRITCWLSLSAVLWVGGGLLPGEARVGLWIAALALEYAGPVARFWTPLLGRSATTDWDVAGAHLTERCGLFVIICLGESVLMIGASFASMAWTPVSFAAFVTAFFATVAMWWIYFHIGYERAARVIGASADPGGIARFGLNYTHIPLIAGIVMAAVSSEMLLAHPLGHPLPEVVVALIGGPALFLVGNLAFKRATARWVPLSHLVGLALLVGLVLVAGTLSPLLVAASAAAILMLVAAWEHISLHPGGT